MSHNNSLGILGEELAQRYLTEHNFFIIETNWRIGSLEIDIIAMKFDILHIVEVKTRHRSISRVDTVSENSFDNINLEHNDFSVHNSFTPSKLNRIMRATNFYVEHIKFDGLVSIDFLGIESYDNGGFNIDFTEGVQW